MQDWTASLFKEEGPRIENHRFVEIIDTSNTGSNRVLRGGGWFAVASYLRSARRYNATPGYSFSNEGFRFCRSVP